VHVSDDPRVGTELAGYRIENLIARGGMSVIYLAADLRLKRKVALKLISPALAQDPEFRRRFLRESELAASLDHPNIVPVYEAGELGDLLFIAMRYVEGGDLKQRLRAGGMKPEETIDLLAQVAGALDAAHERGLVHGDVKPSNALIAPGAGHEGADHVYLADFGLTKRLADGGSLAGDGHLMGTIDYVAPEQIEGGEVDGRADVYSLGCVLYQCLTGAQPFGFETDLGVLLAHLDQDPSRATDLRPELPGAIDAVIACALAKQPADRYRTCRELITAARNALGIAEPRRSRLVRAWVLVGLACLALTAAGLAGFLAFWGGSEPVRVRGDALVRIDPATNAIVDRVAVGARASSVTVGDDGYVWVTSLEERTLTRIDPENGKARSTRIAGTPLDVAVRDGLGVVANGPYEVGFEVINTATGASIDAIRLPGADYAPATVAAGGAGIWVAASGPDGENVGRVLPTPLTSGFPGFERVEITPAPNYLFYLTPDSGSYNDVVVGDAAVWLVRDGGAILKRIDVGLEQVVATVALPFRPKSVAVGAGGVWVTALFDDALARLDLATNEVTMNMPLARGTDGVAVGAGSVWVACTIDGVVQRVDPVKGTVLATIDVGGRPEDVAVGAGGVWVTTHTV
jgi:streptogramin lyase/tRNA A-37 threonylcarbamoyl transferase component Bud32